MKLFLFVICILGFMDINSNENHNRWSRSLYFQNIEKLNFPNQYSENCDGIYCYQITPKVRVDTFSIEFFSKEGEKTIQFSANQMESDSIAHNIELLFKNQIKKEGVYFYSVDYNLKGTYFIDKGFINILK